MNKDELEKRVAELEEVLYRACQMLQVVGLPHDLSDKGCVRALNPEMEKWMRKRQS